MTNLLHLSKLQISTFFFFFFFYFFLFPLKKKKKILHKFLYLGNEGKQKQENLFFWPFYI